MGLWHCKHPNIFGKEEKKMKLTKKARIGIVSGAVICAAAIGIAVAVLLLPSRASEPHPLPEGFTVTAHMGCMGTEMNTLGSLQTALDSGAQTVEFDVRFLADGTPVLGHDEGDKSAASDTIADALAMVAARPGITVNLDLKEFSPLERLQEVVEQAGMMGRVFYTGVDADHIAAVRAATPEIPCYLNASFNVLNRRSVSHLEDLVQLCLDSGAIGINCSYQNNSEQLVRLCHENGLLLSVWTVDNEDDMDIQLDLAPDNITTRRPDILLPKAQEHIERL